MPSTATQPGRSLDLLGIGFGPANLALAIALQEQGSALRARFLERKPEFSWHPGMLLPGARMQVAFMKDLVSLRNPRSAYSFLNYLHEQGRLLDFLNTRTFYPSRVEFNAYLGWAAARLGEACAYGREVVEVAPVTQGQAVERLRVTAVTREGREEVWHAAHLSLGLGLQPHLPEIFAGLRGTPALWHSSAYLERAAAHSGDGEGQRIAIIGSGQSAAEIFLDAMERFPRARIDLVMRGYALKPADSSPFVNEIFNPDTTDLLYGAEPALRGQILQAHRDTNYSVADAEVIDRIYGALYDQKVEGGDRLRIHRLQHVVEAAAQESQLRLTLRDRLTGGSEAVPYDTVILATGYRPSQALALLRGIEPYLLGEQPSRDYRLQTVPGFRPRIYLQGLCEPTHGLSDTLLSVLSVRAGEIAASLQGDGDWGGAARAAAE
ncbi:lysine N(6)-hydroxylase/L-ornithine N(5)-oxygenase family protein [Pseudoroseomonas cervicalis]|uniref:lysine N(6)-hydroxylase/L-ornithine N(5)-oxygenase family protein n=1 Tax=Teichococcus cervicalis TaxID=204525 RepID=UPI0027853717|nr:lysine N(6)-hydroxylase/L-ornithine N(5)-oxygenase family protein [Pseudoroseomonas cervicalis]MDQ1081784.1 L-ornithine N5-oxygenase [Pseudoroseomonas cervicalis]